MRACGKCVARRRGKEGTGVDTDRGDASTDFVMVSALLALITVAILQVSYAFYVRNLLLDAASAGARYGTLHDRNPSESVDRTSEIIRGSLPGNYAQNVSYSESFNSAGARVLEVNVSAPLPVLGPFGLPNSLSVKAHAVYPVQTEE